ncbi:MAG: hypothetical protein ACRD0J_07540 [Acidimicrobiales bacterium]
MTSRFDSLAGRDEAGAMPPQQQPQQQPQQEPQQPQPQQQPRQEPQQPQPQHRQQQPRPPQQPWSTLAGRLTDRLRPGAPPVAITFSASRPEGVPAHDAPLPPPTPDGRTGRVPAGCVFWVQGAERTFSTEPADHGN